MQALTDGTVHRDDPGLAPAATNGVAPAPTGELPVRVIEPRTGARLIDWKELWRHRELLFFLMWRDVKVRYKETVLGAAWAVFKPLTTMAAFSLFFARAAGLHGDADAVPYPLLVFCGLLPWFFFATSLGSSSSSVLANQNLLTKVYFPRLMLPIASLGEGLMDFGIALGMFVILLVGFNVAGYKVYPGWGLLLVPVLVLLLMLAALGMGTLLSALTVIYRDVRHVVPFLTQLWMFLTPAIYLRPEDRGPLTRTWLPLNPAYGLIFNFRQAMLGGDLDWYALAVSSAVALTLLLGGFYYFRRVERTFADII